MIFIIIFAAVISGISFLILKCSSMRWAVVTLIALSFFMIAAFAIGWETALWLHSMSYSDPVRQEWQPRLGRVLSVLWLP
jgi:hypothetical protein